MIYNNFNEIGRYRNTFQMFLKTNASTDRIMFVAFVISFVAIASYLLEVVVLVFGTLVIISSLYQCCGSGMLILYPGSRIQDPTTATKEERGKIRGPGYRNTGSGKNLFQIPDPLVKKGTGSRIRIRNTALYGGTYSSVHTRTLIPVHHYRSIMYIEVVRKQFFYYFADMEAAWSPLNPSDRTISPLTWPSGPSQLGKHTFFFFLYRSMLSQSLRLATPDSSVYSVYTYSVKSPPNQAVKCLTSLAGQTAHKKGH
jgi:hypothetical protein